ncbi:hypothetical protein DS831_02620 [Bombilactobacillus bombi]|uniref:BAX inhibitor (BI)-1/YccA family protein n=1 Tax=Bombilactobacillus bombi TaxID=1303590 RepID=A0A3R6WBR1_9LACO|nr:Bax inhibitor-1 family protein [Bombilactobacillus bombi]MCO6541861.1 Bax inhibitor-1 family protein [Lactobacillus sp.]RHW52239.1 hypothetical protein DS831_02620 [Bombilactobacillus bombi]
MPVMEQTKDGALAKFTSLVYLYTGLGVAFWLLSAFALAKNQAFSMPILMWGAQHRLLATVLAIAIPIGLLYLCQSLAQRSYFLTFVCYIAFLASFSITGMPIFFAYSAKSIVQATSMTAIAFIVMAGYGYFTRTNLMTWSKTLMIGLIAVIVVSILNLVLFKSSLAMLIVNAITMILFLGFIAFDSQNLKQIYQQNQGANLGAIALIASINLVLDFINLLLSLLSIFGNNDN